MAEWRNGGMAEWHNVRYEIVRNQDTECTQMLPWQSPSGLVNSKQTLLVGHFLWDMRSHPKM
jgi:hypothetical protein